MNSIIQAALVSKEVTRGIILFVQKYLLCWTLANATFELHIFEFVLCHLPPMRHPNITTKILILTVVCLNHEK